MVRPLPVLSSPKVQLNGIESPSGSEEPTALKVTDSPLLMFSEGSADIIAVGGSLPERASKHPAMVELSSTAMSAVASLPGVFISLVWKTG